MAIKICAICGAKIDTDKQPYHHTADDEYICFAIHDHKLRTCSTCGELIIKRDGRYRCNRCEDRIYSTVSNSYGTKPFPVFKNFGIKHNNPIKNVRYYGLEMEFNHVSPDICFEKGGDLYRNKWIYNKRDGSISNGVEIVTSPMDFKSAKILIANMDDIFNYVKRGDYRDNAGLHIHVSKNSIPIMDRYKICGLLNSTCTPIERGIMYYLAGRITSPSEKEYNDGYYKLGVSDRIAPLSQGHCVALNTANSTTYEFRLFKSSADKDVLISYIELVNKMLEFCHIKGIDDITISNFIIWLKDNTKNKVILNRIIEFETENTKLRPIKKITYNKFDGLVGINWKQYPELISRIESIGYRRAIRSENALTPLYEYGRIELRNDDSEFIKQLKNTLRRTLIEYILQNQERENEQCA